MLELGDLRAVGVLVAFEELDEVGEDLLADPAREGALEVEEGDGATADVDNSFPAGSADASSGLGDGERRPTTRLQRVIACLHRPIVIPARVAIRPSIVQS